MTILYKLYVNPYFTSRKKGKLYQNQAQYIKYARECNTYLYNTIHITQKTNTDNSN